jgi:hypothetical protein
LFAALILVAFQVMPGCIAEVFAANNERRVPNPDATHGRIVSKDEFASLMMEKLPEALTLKQEDMEAQTMGGHLLTNAVLNVKYTAQELDNGTVDDGKHDDFVYKAIFVGKYAHSYAPCYLKYACLFVGTGMMCGTKFANFTFVEKPEPRKNEQYRMQLSTMKDGDVTITHQQHQFPDQLYAAWQMANQPVGTKGKGAAVVKEEKKATGEGSSSSDRA